MTTNEEKIAATNNANANTSKFDEIFDQAVNDGRLHRELRELSDRAIFRDLLERRRDRLQARAVRHLVADGFLGAGSTPDDIRAPASGSIDWSLLLEALIALLPVIAKLFLL